MDSPFLEISIESTLEKSISESAFINRISKAYKSLYGKDSEIHHINKKLSVRINFDSIADFDKIYEVPYSMYVYLFDNFLNGNDDFEKLFLKNNSLNNSDVDGSDENYLVLRYHTNCISPMRRYYGFTSRVNQIFGAKVVNEEIMDGFLRFIKTKNDFEALLTPGDIETGWKERFKLQNIDLTHPLVLTFFDHVREWKNLWDKQKEL